MAKYFSGCVAFILLCCETFQEAFICRSIVLITSDLKKNWYSLILTTSICCNVNELTFCPTEKETLMGNEGINLVDWYIDQILHVKLS